jgi:hypothetical protein
VTPINSVCELGIVHICLGIDVLPSTPSGSIISGSSLSGLQYRALPNRVLPASGSGGTLVAAPLGEQNWLGLLQR